jgi:hypothetical protein
VDISGDVGDHVKHEFKRNELGEVDMFALSYDWHNGPMCIHCDQAWCHWCTPMSVLEADDCPGDT